MNIMRAIGRRVLVEITTTKKQSKIILTDKQVPDAQFDTSYKILQVGEEVPPEVISIGDVPIFEQHSVFVGTKTIEEVKDVRVVRHGIISYDDIVGIE
jgi:hypothetical protein